MTKFGFRHIVPCFALLSMPACATSPDAAGRSTDAAPLPVLVRQAVPTGATLQALLLGRLHLDADGCLRGNNETGPIIIWRHETRIERAADGRIRIYDPSTGNSVHVGDEIALSGGYRAGPATNVTEPVPPACAQQSRVFVAGPVMSEAQRQALLARQPRRPGDASPPETKR